MSLINEVLNELENRGANVPLGEATIRAVPPRKQSHVLQYAAAGVVLVMLLASVVWFLGGSDSPAPKVESVVAVAPVNAAVSIPADTSSVITSAPVASNDAPALSPPSDSLHGKPLLIVQSDDQPGVVADTSKIKRHRTRPAVGQEVANAEGPEAAQQLKTITEQQRAENEFSRANLAVQEGRTSDALEGYRNALLIDPTYKDARRAWVGLLLKLKRNDEAESVLKKGLRHDPHDTMFAMLLARLQVERDDVPLALETLQKTLPYAGGQAEFHAFMAALLQRQNHHEEAITHYQVALKLVPNNGIWLMGMGISLQALQRNDEARAAYQRALASNTLNAQLQAFVQNKLKEF